MKKSFMHILQHCNRKLVVHQVQDAMSLLKKLQQNDLVFFDDCLYSQYLFIKKYANALQRMNIACAISFSTRIYRREGMPISYAVCSECHDKFHNGDMSALQAYMSIDEVKDLLLYDNVYLACHGAYHLKLDNIKDNYSKAIEFKKDLLTAIEELRQYELNTSIYVFPYAYSRILNAHNMLFKCNFIHVFADEENKRIQIEDLKDE